MTHPPAHPDPAGNPAPPAIPAAGPLAELRRLGAATVHEALGGTGALEGAIKPLHPAMRVVGPVLTVDCQPADNLAIQYAVTVAKPGDVIVVDAKKYTEAGAWGDVLTEFALLAGIAGLVIDGAVRDTARIVELGFPVFARGVSIKGTGKRQPGGVNVPIVCGGVRIRPGDLVVGDADGVVVIPGDSLDAAVALARERAAKEELLRVGLRRGKTLVELLDLGPRLSELEYR